MWEMPFADVELPPGEEPLVLVAPSTVHDPTHRLLRATLEGLAGEPVRVIATTNRRPLPGPIDVPANARLVDWLSYTRVMPRCAAVVCNAGHGTMARALASGAPVVAAPGPGDQNENSARLDWSGLGVRVPWRLVGPRSIRLAVRRALADEGMSARVGAVAAWSAANPGPVRAAEAVEAWVERL
jgi:UDP:flavonoid glycosyltransferase YjiC (YdhE family)